MGMLKATPQVDQKGQQTGKMLLEIFYGGKEAPFGGIDASAPPRYIKPNCFVDSNGFVISNGKIVAGGFFNYGITLDQWLTLNCIYLTSGSFFANGKYNNFALGYTVATTAGPPTVTTVTYRIWVWDAGATGVIALTATLDVAQNNLTVPAETAIGALAIFGGPATAGGTIAITIGGSGPINVTINPADDRNTVAANTVIAINAFVGVPVTASIQAPFSNYVKLTANTAGVAGNAIALSLVQTNGDGISSTVLDNMSGGSDAIDQAFGIPIDPTSWVAVGETLYFAGPGTMILSYSDSPTTGVNFNILTQYLGAVKLAKMGGYLIAGGIVPGPGQTIDDPEMVIAWSAPEGQYGIWNPVDSDGNVTGAGFNQTADISDYITGILITNSMLIVFRTQGLDYASITGSGSLPFDINHISNNLLGEGCQDGRLLTVYDQMALFVGNSDVFQYSGGLKSIGENIRSLLIPASQDDTVEARDSIMLPVKLGSKSVDVNGFIVIDKVIYVYNIDTRTWMQFDLKLDEVNGNFARFAIFASTANVPGSYQFNIQQLLMLITQEKQGVFPFHSLPVFWQYQNFLQNVDFDKATAPFVVFPQEEIEFGRDITIDGLNVEVAGMPGQVVNFSITGTIMQANKPTSITKNFVLTIGAEGDGETLNEYQVYPSNGTFVGRAPQLRYDILLSATGVKNPFSIAKIGMYGSFEPSQRPI